MDSRNSDMNLVSLNVRGLKLKHKRRQLFSLFKRNQYDVVCLQETHITEKEVEQWKKEWGGELLYTQQTSNSGGLVILCKPSKCSHIKEIHSEARILAISLKVIDKTMAIVNVYAPNSVQEKLPFLCRPLDGAIRLCYQGHKTKLVPSEGILLLTLLQIFFDHYCVKFIFQQ